MDSPEYRVSLTPVADEHLSKMPRDQQEKVAALLLRMQQSPAAGASPLKQVKPMVWKKRLGDIRVLFTLDTREREVVVRAILWRREDTYDDLAAIAASAEFEMKQRRAKEKGQGQRAKRKKKK